MALSPSTKKFLQQRFFIRRVLFGSFVFSILVFGAVLYTQADQFKKSTSYEAQQGDIVYGDGDSTGTMEVADTNSNSNDQLPMMLGLIALMNVVMAFVLPQILAKQQNYKSLKQKPVADFLRGQKDRYGNPVWSENKIAEITQLPESEQYIYVLSNGTFISSIIQWALFESVAIMGFVATTMTGNFNTFLPFGAVALVLMFLTAPVSGMVEKKAKRMARKAY